MNIIRLLLFLLLIIFTIVFSVSNRKLVSVDLYPFPFVLDMSLYLIILLSIAVGVFLCGLSGLVVALDERRDDYLKNKRIKALEDEIEAIKVDQKVKALL